MSRREAVTLAVISSILSSIAWIFQGEAVRELSPLAVASVQGILTGLIYLFHLAHSNRAFPWRSIRSNWRMLLQFVLLRNFLASILVCTALLLSDSIKIMFFTKLEPYFVLFWAWLCAGQKITRSHAALLAVHIGGAVLLSTGGRVDMSFSQAGDIMIICAIGILSWSYLKAAALSQEVGPFDLNGISGFAGGLLLLPFALVSVPSSVWHFSSPGWLHVVIVVLLFNVFGMTMWYAVLPHLEGWLVSALRAIGPVFAAPLAWTFFGQRMGAGNVIGGMIVLVTSVLLTRAPVSLPSE